MPGAARGLWGPWSIPCECSPPARSSEPGESSPAVTRPCTAPPSPESLCLVLCSGTHCPSAGHPPAGSAALPLFSSWGENKISVWECLVKRHAHYLWLALLAISRDLNFKHICVWWQAWGAGQSASSHIPLGIGQGSMLGNTTRSDSAFVRGSAWRAVGRACSSPRAPSGQAHSFQASGHGGSALLLPALSYLSQNSVRNA